MGKTGRMSRGKWEGGKDCGVVELYCGTCQKPKASGV